MASKARPAVVPGDAVATDAPRPAGRWIAALATAYLALVAAFAATSSAAGIRLRHTVPMRDDWRILDEMFVRPSLAHWLWADQNGHRMPGTLLLIYLDYVWLHGRMLLPVAASIAFTWLAGAAIAGAFGREAGRTGARLTLGFALFLLFWAVSSYDFTWGLEASAVMSATWVVVALAAFGAYVVRRRAQPPRRTTPCLLLTLGAATCASFSHGPGFSVWPALVATGLVVRAPRRTVALFGAAAAAELAVYVTGLRHGNAASGMALLRQYPVEMGTMLAAYVGAPVTRAVTAFGRWSPDAAYTLGAGVGALALAVAAGRAAVVAATPAPVRQRDVLGIGLMCASATSGAMVSLYRFPWMQSAIDIRFALWTALFWVGLVCTVPRGGAAASPRTGAAVLLVVALSAAMLPSLAQERIRRSVEADHAEGSALLHVLGIQWDPASGGTAFGPSPERSYRVVAHMRTDGRSMFADHRAGLLGSRLADRFAVVPDRPCRGGVVWREPLDARTGPALRVAGWTSEPGPPAALAAVVTDAGGVIRGLAVHVAGLAPLLPTPLPAIEHGWLGAVAAYDRGPYRVYAIRPDGRSACEVAAIAPAPAGPGAG